MMVEPKMPTRELIKRTIMLYGGELIYDLDIPKNAENIRFYFDQHYEEVDCGISFEYMESDEDFEKRMKMYHCNLEKYKEWQIRFAKEIAEYEKSQRIKKEKFKAKRDQEKALKIKKLEMELKKLKAEK